MRYYYHTEIGTLNGYFRYMVVPEKPPIKLSNFMKTKEDLFLMDMLLKLRTGLTM